MNDITNIENETELTSKDLEGALREMCKLLAKNGNPDFCHGACPFRNTLLYYYNTL